MAEYQNVDIPIGIGASLSDEAHNKLYEAMIIHEKPLTNALGRDFRSILDRNQARLIFERM